MEKNNEKGVIGRTTHRYRRWHYKKTPRYKFTLLFNNVQIISKIISKIILQ